MDNIIIAVITGIVSIITCVISTRTGKKVDENHKQMDNAIACIMRNDITTMYYQHKAEKKLKQYERESLDKLYEGYSEGGHNSFVKDIYAEMRKWEIEQ